MKNALAGLVKNIKNVIYNKPLKEIDNFSSSPLAKKGIKTPFT